MIADVPGIDKPPKKELRPSLEQVEKAIYDYELKNGMIKVKIKENE